jgi:hypothetical protein
MILLKLIYGKYQDLQEIKIKDKTLMDKVKLIDSLPAEEKNIVLKIIEMAITKKKFKDFFKEELTA